MRRFGSNATLISNLLSLFFWWRKASLNWGWARARESLLFISLLQLRTIYVWSIDAVTKNRENGCYKPDTAPHSSHTLNVHQLLRGRRERQKKTMDSWQQRRHSCILHAWRVVHALLEAITPIPQDFLQPECASLSSCCLFCRRTELGVPSRLGRAGCQRVSAQVLLHQTGL